MNTVDLLDIQVHYAKQANQPTLLIPEWSVKQGSKIFIYGPSGSGKSTLLNLLSGLISPNTGKVKILGEQLDQMNGRQLDNFRANNIGYISQQFNLIPYLSAIDNIRLACHFSKKEKITDKDQEIEALLSSLNIYESDWKKSTRYLSLGQQQRIAIARALINTPNLIIADEPTSSLDQVNTDLFMNQLMSLTSKHDSTLIFVSHDMSLANYFDHVESINDINHLEVAKHNVA